MQQFTNYGHTPVVLDRIVLLHPLNEHLIGSYAMPGQLAIGTVHWPPHGPGLPPAWKDRKPVPGFRLAPGKTFNMVLGVAAIARGGVSSVARPAAVAGTLTRSGGESEAPEAGRLRQFLHPPGRDPQQVRHQVEQFIPGS